MKLDRLVQSRIMAIPQKVGFFLIPCPLGDLDFRTMRWARCKEPTPRVHSGIITSPYIWYHLPYASINHAAPKVRLWPWDIPAFSIGRTIHPEDPPWLQRLLKVRNTIVYPLRFQGYGPGKSSRSFMNLANQLNQFGKAFLNIYSFYLSENLPCMDYETEISIKTSSCKMKRRCMQLPCIKDHKSKWAGSTSPTLVELRSNPPQVSTQRGHQPFACKQDRQHRVIQDGWEATKGRSIKLVL